MPDVTLLIGSTILTAVEAAGVAGPAGFALSSTTIAGVSAATVVGTAAIIGVSIGLQYALNNPDVPKPENGAIPLKQAIPPRQRGYWINRLSGNYMLFLAAGNDSQDVIAFHSGRIESVIQVYLHDQPVNTTPVITDGAAVSVIPPGGDQFDGVTLQVFFGSDTQSVYGIISSPVTSGIWTTDFHGRGIAALCMVCPQTADPTVFTQKYPQRLPLPSVVANCAPIWDPRDVAQTLAATASWKASDNPILQLIDYLTEPDGGMGEDRDIILPPAALAQLMVEADLCDQIVGGVKRYTSAGWYQFDNAPENIINKILATCDGWLAESGDGSLVLTIGVYREPTDPPITAAHILGYSVRYGGTDEEAINQLIVSYTNPALGYVTDQIDAVRDEDAIALAGIVRSKPLDLPWVQIAAQAERLAERAMLRLNPAMSGTLITTLYGMRYLGKRWVKVQFPSVRGLEDCVVEIQDRAQVDLLAGRVTFNWTLVDTTALAALDA